jgi:predicted phage terminase large subunit-like protein
MTKTVEQREAELLSFREFIRRVSPKFQFYEHVDKLIAVLQRVADGEIDRLMVFMPPRHGKSETVSRLFSAYYAYRYPARWVGLNSYAAALAFTLSRNARENYREAGGIFNPSATGVEQWETSVGGGLWAAGVGGPITGKGFHLGIIDDPLKNSEEAASETIREKQRDWYRSTFYTRAEPGAAIIVIQTRWHEDDLSGWLLAQEGDDEEEPERWHIVCMEAIKDEQPQSFPQTCTVEPDTRQPGEALCPERYPLARLWRMAKRIGAYFWAALFQQRPQPKDGDFFKRQWFEIVGEVPSQAQRIRWWDLASSTAPTADQTVGVLIARVGSTYYVEDVVCGRWSAADRDRIILQTARMDAQKYGNTVQQWGEQEPGSSGKDAAQAFVRLLQGYPARYETSTGSKEVRADPYAAQCQAGNVKLKSAPWNQHYLEELAAFPRGRHDDQVDGSSGAFNKLASRPDMTGIDLGNLTKESTWNL